MSRLDKLAVLKDGAIEAFGADRGAAAATAAATNAPSQRLAAVPAARNRAGGAA